MNVVVIMPYGREDSNKKYPLGLVYTTMVPARRY